jgi:hypothetical protein
LLYWLCTCVNFIPNSEGSVALFLSVVCPTLFLQSIVCSRSAVHCLKSRRAALLLQDTRREGAFTFSLLPSEIAFVFFYHIRQPCYYEGLFFYVEEFSTTAVY